MALSTSQPNQNAVVSEPIYRKVQRACLAVCIVLAPLVIFLGFLCDPQLGVPDWNTIISTWQAANPLRLQLFLFFNVVTPLFFPLSYIGLGLLAMKRSPWLALAGIACGLVGSLPWPFFVEAEAMIYALAHIGNSAATAAVLSNTSAVWVGVLLQYCWVIGHLLGYVLLGIALFRARTIPLWAAALIIASVPFQMIAYPMHQGWLQISGFVLVFIGSIPAALAMLKRPEEEKH